MNGTNLHKDKQFVPAAIGGNIISGLPGFADAAGTLHPALLCPMRLMQWR